MTSHDTTHAIDPKVRIRHVNLKFADLERALRFYCDVPGSALTQRYGSQTAFVSAGGNALEYELNSTLSLCLQYGFIWLMVVKPDEGKQNV